jgi:3-deoxy-manno-octulosonate cytidylyltransferase (CMP-KDO synthetase)
MSVLIVIPARYDSTRFPGKPLAPLKGKPLIQHVYENSLGAVLAGEVVVATDSETIFERVLSFGGKSVMTSSDHTSGTDRVAEVARSMDYDIIVNVQGDEPLIRPQMIDDVISLLSDSRADIGTLVKSIEEPEEIMDPNVVKAVFGEKGFALYFSRAPIPYHRDSGAMSELMPGKGFMEAGSSRMSVGPSRSPRPAWSRFYKHIGIYSYKRDVLLRLTEMKPTALEKTEKLEQLRALEHGFAIKVKETAFEIIGVDTPQDLERAETWLSLSS